MALLVMVGVWTYGIRQKGAKGYFKHFLEPYPCLLPLNILEELIKPITLALRLFGNIFAGGIMLALIAALIAWTLGPIPVGGVLAIVFNIIWKLFDMAIGAIQAFIFALLTVLYFGMAGAGHDEHDEHEPTHDDATADADDGSDAANPNSRPERPARPHQRYTRSAGHPARNQGETVAAAVTRIGHQDGRRVRRRWPGPRRWRDRRRRR